MSEPITREEIYLAAIAGDGVELPNPITREEMYLAAAAGMAVELPNPITRKEQFLQRVVESGGTGGGGDDTLYQALSGKPMSYANNNLKIIPQYGLYMCTGLNSISIPSVTEVKDYGLYGCSALKNVSAPNIKIIGAQGFRNCAALQDFDFSNVEEIGMRAFANCTSLTKVTLGIKGVVISVATYAFSSCSNLRAVEFKNILRILASVFSGCSELKVIIHRNSTISTLDNVSAFSNTCFASGGTGGVLLVPAKRVENFKKATNWSVIFGYGTNRFLALEDYTVDGTTTGEIDWDKVNALFEEAST